jgi:hypothetical protein
MMAGGKSLTGNHLARNAKASIGCARTPSVATGFGAIGGGGNAGRPHISSGTGIAAKATA